MPRHRSSSPPTYRLHKQSGQAVVTLRDPGTGRRRDVLLGKHGTPESRGEYARVIAEWEATTRLVLPACRAGRLPSRPGDRPPADLTVNEVLAAFMRHCESYYVKDGKPTSEQREYKLVMAALRELYGHGLARDFGPLSLKAVRQRMVEGGLSRGVINQRVGRIKRLFRWATGEGLVPPEVYQGLEAVEGLKCGRTAARETEPVKPVADDLVERTLLLLNCQVAAMVRLQRLTGMRPGEVTAMRAADIDMTGAVWLYRPAGHKTQHHGKERVIALGPRAQAIVKQFLKPDLAAYLFSPRDAQRERYAALRAARKTRVQPSQACRSKAGARRLGDRYRHRSYHEAIQRACERAGLPHWHPHQLRHAHGTEVRRQFGLEAAQVALGHSRADVTQVYAERDLKLAVEVAKTVG